MNKRLLSILLVLCMVLVSVPVFALSATAAGATASAGTKVYGYTSSYGENLPQGSSATNGAWSIGNKWADTAVSSFAAMTWLGSSGNYVGIATRSNAFVNISNITNQQNFYGPIGSVGAAPGQDVAVRYTAEKTGVVDIILDKLGNGATLVGGSFSYAIYVNGTKVWPTDSSWYTITKTANGQTIYDPNKGDMPCYDDAYIFSTATVVAEGIAVEAGMKIDFICRTTNTLDTTWSTGGNEIFPTIAYTMTNTTNFKTSFNSTTNLPVQNADGTVTYSGNWTPMSYPMNNPLGGTAMDKKNVNISGDYISATADGDGGGTPGMLVKNASNGLNGNYHAVVGQVNPIGGAKGAGVRYTVQSSGVMSVNFSMIGKYTNDTYTGTSTDYRYGIYINGNLVWPVQGGNLSDAPALPQKQNTNLNALNGIAVIEGDVVDFVCYKIGAWTNGWAGAGQVMFPDITIVSGESYSTSFNTESNFPAFDGTTITYSGNWTYNAYYPKGGYGIEDAANGLLLDQPSGNTGWDGKGFSLIDDRGNAWADRPHVVTASFNKWFSEAGQVTLGAGNAIALRYTAEKTGYANVRIDRLANTSSASIGTFTYSVYVNGIKLWSTSITTADGSTYGDVSTAGAFEALSHLYLVEGDRVEFVTEASGANIWDGAGSIFFGSVHYYNLTEKYVPTGASVNVAVTDSFTANGAGVTTPKNVTNVKTGFLVNGVKKGATDALFTAVAKDIANEVVVTPYYETSFGSIVTGTPVTTSIKALLEAYQSDAKYGAAATAALSYAATAKAYFENTTTPVAPTVMPSGTYTNQLAVVEPLADARVIPQQVALLLNERVSFKFTVKGAVAGDKMEITDGTNTYAVAIVDGAAIFEGISVKSWNTLYTFRVLDADGNAVSASFTYSVSTYYARMGAENTNLTNLVNAMMAFYEAAVAATN